MTRYEMMWTCDERQHRSGRPSMTSAKTLAAVQCGGVGSSKEGLEWHLLAVLTVVIEVN